MYDIPGYLCTGTNNKDNISNKKINTIELFKLKIIKLYSAQVKKILVEFIDDVHKLANILFENEELSENDLNEINLTAKCIANKNRLLVDTKYANLWDHDDSDDDSWKKDNKKKGGISD